MKVVKSAQAPQDVSAAKAPAPAATGAADGAPPAARALSPARIRDIVMVAAGLLDIALDQLTKHLVVSYFVTPGYRAPVPIFGQILTLDYVQNTGVAFSMFEGNNVQFVLIALAIAVICYLYWRFRDRASLALKLAFGFVLGGAAGNLIDRFRQGYVVDFIHFQIPAINFNFAVFNFADSSISVGVVAIAVLLYFTAGQDEARTKQATSMATGATATSAANAKGLQSVSPAPKTPGATAMSGVSKTNVGKANGARGASGANSPRVRRKAAGGRRRG